MFVQVGGLALIPLIVFSRATVKKPNDPATMEAAPRSVVFLLLFPSETWRWLRGVPKSPQCIIVVSLNHFDEGSLYCVKARNLRREESRGPQVRRVLRRAKRFQVRCGAHSRVTPRELVRTTECGRMEQLLGTLPARCFDDGSSSCLVAAPRPGQPHAVSPVLYARTRGTCTHSTTRPPRPSSQGATQVVRRELCAFWHTRQAQRPAPQKHTSTTRAAW